MLYKGDYAGAAQKAKEVMDLGVYDLFDSVDDLWKVANENGIEHIFSVQYLAGVQGSGYSSTFAIRGAEPPLTGYSTAIVPARTYWILLNQMTNAVPPAYWKVIHFLMALPKLMNHMFGSSMMKLRSILPMAAQTGLLSGMQRFC